MVVTPRTALARRRVAVGHSQESLAELLKVERSTVGRWEQGKTAPQPWVRPDLAAALGLATDQLDGLLRLDSYSEPIFDGRHSGTDVDGVPPSKALGGDQVRALRRLIDVYDLPEDGPIRLMAELRRAASAVVVFRLNSDYSRVVEQLTILLPELTRALFLCQGDQRASVARLLVQAYRAADAVADKFGFYDLSARIIQVMRWAAERAEDELALAATSYVRAETFFANGRLDAGRRMLEQAADRLRPGASMQAAAAYGSLHMRAAVVAARAGQTTRAQDHLSEARSMSTRVNEGVYEGTAFGPASVRIHEVTLALDLGLPHGALAAAAGWLPSGNVPAERRSHFYIDVARAQFLLDRSGPILDALETAWLIAPEHVRVHPQVRELLVAFADRSDESRTAVRKFAATAGITGAGRLADRAR
jgi:transcriptional regulator with XRE-family HTH domain